MEEKRCFTINEILLEQFKVRSKKASKTYKQALAEALELWLKKQRT